MVMSGRMENARHVYDVWIKQFGEGVEESEREAATSERASRQTGKQARAT